MNPPDHILRVKFFQDEPREERFVVLDIMRELGLRLAGEEPAAAGEGGAATLWLALSAPIPFRVAALFGRLQRELGPRDRLLVMTHVHRADLDSDDWSAVFDLSTPTRRILVYDTLERLPELLRHVALNHIWHSELRVERSTSSTFAGRTSELRSIIEATQSSANLILHGSRRIGKSALLLRTATLLSNLQRPHARVTLADTADGEAFFRHLNRALGDPLRLTTHLKVWSFDQAAPSSIGQRGGLRALPALKEPWHELTERVLEAALEDNPKLTLLLDDLDRFLQRVDDDTRQHTLRILSHHLAANPELNLIASCDQPRAFRHHIPSPTLLRLLPLSAAEADSLLHLLGPQLDLNLDIEARSTTRELFGHNPDLLTRLLHLIRLQLPGARKLTFPTIEAILEAVLGRPETLNLPDWWSLDALRSPDAVTVLEHILTLCLQGHVPLEQLWSRLRNDLPQGAPLNALREVLDALEAQGYLIQKEGAYGFSCELYRLHFERAAMARAFGRGAG